MTRLAVLVSSSMVIKTNAARGSRSLSLAPVLPPYYITIIAFVKSLVGITENNCSFSRTNSPGVLLKKALLLHNPALRVLIKSSAAVVCFFLWCFLMAAL